MIDNNLVARFYAEQRGVATDEKNLDNLVVQIIVSLY